MEKIMKRRGGDDPEGPNKKRNTRSVPETEASVGDVKAQPPPSEEEVEEFFAILRRMHAAVKHFENGRADRTSTTWRTALESEVVAVDDGEVVCDDGERKMKERSGEEMGLTLDLNAVPGESHAD